MKQPGFMIYAEDWEVYTEDYSDEELGQMLRAMLLYFSKGEETAFSDRSMRQFFRQTTRSIDADAKHYEDKCRKNAYNRYKGLCRQMKVKALPFDRWVTEVDDRQQPSPIPTTNVQQPTPTANPQQAASNTQHTKPTPSLNSAGADGSGSAAFSPLGAEAFEKRRKQALASLKAAGVWL